jgi:putative toxin-antitoxin system antitoxin component (TIGR02293 family)
MYNKGMIQDHAPYTPASAVFDAVLPGAKLLKLKARNVSQLERELDKGLSMKTIESLAAVAQVSLKSLAPILGLGYSTLITYKRKSERLNPEQSARAYHFARILERATEVIGNEAQQWLSEPVLALAKRTPLETLHSTLGSERVLQLLERLDDGVYS